MNKYIYNGPVKVFDTVVNPCWAGQTIASSERKARNNLAYQYKKEFNKSRDARVSLPGKLSIIRSGV
jgi:hypothetical protein